MTDVPETPRMNRRDMAKARTRQKVLDAATALFEGDGYEAGTIRDIAKAAGMSTGAVFANFEDKAELYDTIYGHPPISAEMGREMMLILRGFALNARHISVRPEDDVFGGALEKLLILAQAGVAHVWPEGLRSDVTGDFVVDPEAAKEAAERVGKAPR